MDAKRCADCGYKGPFRICGDGRPEGSGRLYARVGPAESPIIVCDECASKRELAFMLKHGSAVLYLVGTGRTAKVQDWSGKLSLPVYGSTWTGRHNLAGAQEFAQFRVPGDPFMWSGRRIGDSQIFRCKRTKKKA